MRGANVKTIEVGVTPSRASFNVTLVKPTTVDVGVAVGAFVGAFDGAFVGAFVGAWVGTLVKATVRYPVSVAEFAVVFVDVATNRICVAVLGFAAIPPLHVKTVGADPVLAAIPPAGAYSTSTVAEVVTAATVPTPGAAHETEPVVLNVDACCAVIVIVSPLTSASITPMLNIILPGTAPPARLSTLVWLPHTNALPATKSTTPRSTIEA
jgi:hypothetical protein